VAGLGCAVSLSRIFSLAAPDANLALSFPVLCCDAPDEKKAPC
jgi:hypothetical protein